MAKYEHMRVGKTPEMEQNVEFLKGYFGVGTRTKAIAKGLDLAVRVLNK